MLLASFKNEKPIQLAELIKHYPQFSSLADVLFPSQVEQVIPLSKLAVALQVLSSIVPNNSLAITIEPEIANLQKVEPPLNFSVNYVWSKISCRLERLNALDAVYLGEGWFVKGNRYWQVLHVTGKDDQWLLRDKIEGQAVIDFLMHIKTNWQQRKLPFHTQLTFSNAPIVSVHIEKVTETEVCLKMTWLEQVSQIEMGPFADGYVIFANTVRPGVHPQELGIKKLKENGVVCLCGNEITRFQEVAWPLIKPWTTGEVRQFEAQYAALDTSNPTLFTIGRATPAKAMPVPPRQTAVSPSSAVSRSSKSDVVTSREKNFVQLARKLVNHREKRASFVPFQHYWPQYEDMNKEQAKWYFYWRDKVRQQQYLDTDLSYIFMHVYELLNQIGVQNNLDGYYQLQRLWQNYRQRYPQLNRYLPDWLADYVIVYRCPVKPLQIYVEAIQEQFNLPNGIEIAVNHYAVLPFVEMPFELLEKLTGYQLRRSKFYQAGNQELLETCIPQVLDHVNVRLQQRIGQTIWEHFHPQQYETIRRQPFSGAIYAGSTNEITVAVLVPYYKYQPLRDFLTGVVKYTENKLREVKGGNGRLQPPPLDPSITTFIDAFIANITDIIVPPPAKPQVTIDLDEVTRLEEDAVALFQLLHIPEEESLPSLPTPPTTIESITPANAAKSDTPLSQHSDTPIEPLDLELEPSNSPQHLGIDATKPALPSIVTSSDTPKAINTPISANNAIEPPSSPLIIDPTELLRLEQETASLFQLLHIPEEEAVPSSVSIAPAATIVREAPETNHHLPSEWLEFTHRLTKYQLDVLVAILEESDPRGTINKIANLQMTMPAPLLDAINELADETIGDLLIETNTVPKVSDESYIELIQQAVAIRQ